MRWTLLLLLSASAGLAAAQSQKGRLRASLFEHYDKLVKADDQTTVRFALHLIDLGYCPHKQVQHV